MLELWQKEVNEKWIAQLKDTIKDNGVWIWEETGFIYKLKDGELVGDSEEADEALKAILP